MNPGKPGMVVVESKDYHDALTSYYTKTVSVDAAEGIHCRRCIQSHYPDSRKREIATSLHLSERDVASGCITIADDFAGANIIDSTNALEVQSALGQLLKELLP